MIVWFFLSLLLTAAGLKLYIDKLSKTRPFRREKDISDNKKTCIQELHGHKAGTPTMGGLAICLTLFVLTLAYYITTGTMLWSHLFLLLFGAMGFVDDAIKVKKRRDGVTPREKLLGLTAISAAFVVCMLATHQLAPTLRLPFSGAAVDMNPVAFGVLTVFLLVASCNSMNLTDGLDGLAAGLGAIAFACIGVFAWRLHHTDVLFGAVLFEGACLAMLAFNKYPARVFMGDTGSLLLGGAVAILLTQLGLPLWIVLILIVCVFETVSVILQVIWLRCFGKRLFLIAPFHHHLEKRGWHETRIVLLFWAVTLVACLAASFSLGGAL